MRYFCRGFLSLCVVVTFAAPLNGEPLRGFDDDGAAAQRELEVAYDELLAADDLRQWMQRLSAKPHHVGSAYGKQNDTINDISGG